MASAPADASGLARRIGPFDATMIVMGGIVGSGIFANPREVAVGLPSAPWLLAAWGVGGVMALLGALIYAELAARRPGVGGQYAYLRDAYHPLAAFLYGWVPCSSCRREGCRGGPHLRALRDGSSGGSRSRRWHGCAGVPPP